MSLLRGISPTQDPACTPCDLVGHRVGFTQASPQICNSWEQGRMCSRSQADLDLGCYSSSIAAEVEIPEI